MGRGFLGDSIHGRRQLHYELLEVFQMVNINTAIARRPCARLTPPIEITF
jgi:hypothetical protein